MAEIQVRKAKLSDARRIADFVNQSHPKVPVTRQDVISRFGQVGFLIALDNEAVIGLIGWQVENLVIQMTDFLLSTDVDREKVGGVMITAIEEQGLELQVEASILCLPAAPSTALVAYWERFGYAYQEVAALYRAWREAINEWAPGTEKAMVKSLRDNVVLRPM